MKNTKSRSVTNMPIGAAIAIGSGASLVLVLCLNIIGAILITNGTVSESMTVTLTIATQFLSALLGSTLSGMLAKKKYAIVTMATVAAYSFVLWSGGTIIFNSMLNISITNIIGIVLSGVISCFLCISLFEKRTGKRKLVR